jgi:c-di-GMP-binding flagellar brake protein YcgR
MTENSKKEDKRKFKRLQINLNAKYLSEENQKEWKGCTVINISREGMGIEVYLQENIHIGSVLQLKIIIPTKEEPIKATGIMRWIKEQGKEMNYIGGIEFIEIDSEDKWILLDYAYDDWSEKGEE